MSYDYTKNLQDADVKRSKLALKNLTIVFTKKGSIFLVKRPKSEYLTRGLANKVVYTLK